MKRIAFLAAVLLILTGCEANGNSPMIENDTASAPQAIITEMNTTAIQQEDIKTTESSAETVMNEINAEYSETDESTETSIEIIPDSETKLQIEVNGYTLTAELADNSSAQALAELIRNEPLTLTLNEYGSFEKVGSLPQSLPVSDESITTESGDIMLYLGNQITIFYGSNTWSYTRLAKIDSITQTELKDIFGDGDVTVTLSLI